MLNRCLTARYRMDHGNPFQLPHPPTVDLHVIADIAKVRRSRVLPLGCEER